MSLEKRIRSQRLISFYLFLSASLALLASLWVNNYLVSFKFTYGTNDRYYLSETPGETRDFYLDCNLENNYCQNDIVLAILTRPLPPATTEPILKTNTSLDSCFKYVIAESYHIDGKVYDYYELFPIGAVLKTEYRGKKIIYRVTVSNLEDKQCIKNTNAFKYYKIFPIVYEITKKIKDSGISLGSDTKVNPFLYGELSISNMVKRFPINLIFKSLLYIGVILMIFYWINYNYLFKQIISDNKNYFFIFGLGSAIFLFLHVLFLGWEIQNEIFHKIRRLIIILFIFFELTAQILLTMGLYKNMNFLKKFFHVYIIKSKIYFVSVVIFVTLCVLVLLIFKNLPDEVDYILEWNYFLGLLFFYLLSSLMFKRINKPES